MKRVNSLRTPVARVPLAAFEFFGTYWRKHSERHELRFEMRPSSKFDPERMSCGSEDVLALAVLQYGCVMDAITIDSKSSRYNRCDAEYG